MSQYQAGSAGPPVKYLKQTALTWKVKNKATSQLARSDARLAGSDVNQVGHGETVLLKVLTWGIAAPLNSTAPLKSSGFGGTCRILLREIS